MRPLSKTGSFIYSLPLSFPFLDILKSRCNLSDPKISVDCWRAQVSVVGQKTNEKKKWDADRRLFKNMSDSYLR